MTMLWSGWEYPRMEQIPMSKFKATCPAILRRVSKTRKPVVVTRFGVALAEVVPPRPVSKLRKNWLGMLAGTAETVGDYCLTGTRWTAFWLLPRWCWA